MATSTKIGRAIKFAAAAAHKRHAQSEFDRLDAFVCYLSGALKNCGAEGEALSDEVFTIFDQAQETEIR
jgi:hypothetical protein